MFADVRYGQESISKQPWYILPAVMVVFSCSHAHVSQSTEIRSACCDHVADCLVTLHFIGSGFECNVDKQSLRNFITEFKPIM